MSYNLTPAAVADLHAVARYTAERWGIKQRNTYLKKLERRFEWLAENPLCGRLRDDIEQGYYCYPEGAHVVFYTIQETSIDIIGIPHKAMDYLSYFHPDAD